ncbi:hypothetical protein RUMHYD_00648 [Blautia hydrogenotrophica DSM 10507]|uniref:Uncharacterized protein n=1 Tax=Blautia hydrogenotrophica (strain DSM 10507 / JCM 14656 / S5a33) TaxID=476272 RepID=C0CII4_BLAHS|nr:hypothetical protein RUMHYD_00648 [Blautia hydrogenotrophica DSM 10507]
MFCHSSVFKKNPWIGIKNLIRIKKRRKTQIFPESKKEKKYPLGWLTKPEKLLYNKPCQKINKKVGGTGI